MSPRSLVVFDSAGRRSKPFYHLVPKMRRVILSALNEWKRNVAKQSEILKRRWQWTKDAEAANEWGTYVALDKDGTIYKDTIDQ